VAAWVGVAQAGAAQAEEAMSTEQEIVANTKATMSIKGLSLSEDSARRIESYLKGNSSLEESVEDLLKRYKAT